MALATNTGVLEVGQFDSFEDVMHGELETEDDEEEGEILFAMDDGQSASQGDNFDSIVAELELIMMDEEFNKRVGEFTEKHCSLFEDNDENKLEYTSVFSEYTSMIEEYIEEKLGAAIQSFDMAAFCARLAASPEDLPDALDTLSALADFEAFKAMMLSCKVGSSIEKGDSLCLLVTPLQVHSEEQEDGEAMPDLNLSITAPVRGLAIS